MTEWTRGDPAKAPARAPLATGGTLDLPTLLAAYRAGIFPWYNEDEPIQWWCPDPRFVLIPSELRVTASLRKTLRHPGWRVTFDQDFEGVMRACAEAPRPGQDGTWITEEMVAAYVALHRAGYAHSVEVHWGDERVGGLYGVAIGRIFHGESMFHRRSDASKVGFVRLVERLVATGFVLIDCQVPTEHLGSLGAGAVRRKDFLDCLRAQRDLPPTGDPWFNDAAASGV